MDWISIKERKPGGGQKVFYYFEFFGVCYGEFHHIKEDDEEYDCFIGPKGFACGGEVTHWMPLPEYWTQFPLPPK